MERVWELKGLLLVNVRHRFDLCVVIRANVTRFLCESAKHLPLSNGCERVPRLNEDLRRVLCKVTAGQIHTKEKRHSRRKAWYLYTAPGKRLPTQTPSTAYLLCLPFFAFLVTGLPVGLVATSSARNSWAVQSASAVSKTRSSKASSISMSGAALSSFTVAHIFF